LTSIALGYVNVYKTLGHTVLETGASTKLRVAGEEGEMS
jgi:hypothetical protein